MGLFSGLFGKVSKAFWEIEMDRNQRDYYKQVLQGTEKIKAMNDQAVLKRIALESPTHEFRDSAAKRLTDQTDLLEVYRQEQSQYIREKIVGKMDSKEVLGSIAKADPSEIVREAAVKKITDERLLAEIAGKDASVKVRAAIIKSGKIKDEQTLFALAKKAENVRYNFGIIQGKQVYFSPGVELLKGINDQDLIVKAIQGKFAGVHDAGVSLKLDGPHLLTLAADETIDAYIQNNIMDLLSKKVKTIDETVLAEILCREEDSSRDYTCAKCVDHMEDPVAIEKVAAGAKLVSLRIRALKKLTKLRPEGVSAIAHELLCLLENDKAKLELLRIMKDTDREAAAAAYLDLTTEAHALDVRWEAALALSKIKPEEAVAPLMALLLDYREHRHAYIGNLVVSNVIAKAVNFLKNYYVENAGGAMWDEISKMPSGVYYARSSGLCEHDDVSIHFDLA